MYHREQSMNKRYSLTAPHPQSLDCWEISVWGAGCDPVGCNHTFVEKHIHKYFH